MKTTYAGSNHARQIYHCEVTREEAMMSDRDLINLADAHGNVERAKNIYNFGGEVHRNEDGTLTIHVYID